MDFEQPTPEFWNLVSTQRDWNPYFRLFEWVPVSIPALFVIGLLHSRRAAFVLSVFLIAVAGTVGGYLYTRAGEHSLEVLSAAAKTEGDRTWVAHHDTLVMMPIEGFISGAWWSFISTGALWFAYAIIRGIVDKPAARTDPSPP